MEISVQFLLFSIVWDKLNQRLTSFNNDDNLSVSLTLDLIEGSVYQEGINIGSIPSVQKKGGGLYSEYKVELDLYLEKVRDSDNELYYFSICKDKVLRIGKSDYGNLKQVAPTQTNTCGVVIRLLKTKVDNKVVKESEALDKSYIEQVSGLVFSKFVQT